MLESLNTRRYCAFWSRGDDQLWRVETAIKDRFSHHVSSRARTSGAGVRTSRETPRVCASPMPLQGVLPKINPSAVAYWAQRLTRNFNPNKNFRAANISACEAPSTRRTFGLSRQHPRSASQAIDSFASFKRVMHALRRRRRMSRPIHAGEHAGLTSPRINLTVFRFKPYVVDPFWAPPPARAPRIGDNFEDLSSATLNIFTNAIAIETAGHEPYTHNAAYHQ